MLRSALLGAAVLATVASVQPATSDIPLADGGRLTFVHPSSWTGEVGGPTMGPTLKLQARDGKPDFRVMITAIPMEKGSKLTSTEELEHAVQERADGMLATSTQKAVTLARVDGSQAKGFVYHLTDKNAEQGPGDYRELNQGAVTLGPYLLSFTILTHPGDDATVKDALRMLAGASYQAGH